MAFLENTNFTKVLRWALLTDRLGGKEACLLRKHELFKGFQESLKFKNTTNYIIINYHSLCASRFRDKTDRTSDTNLRASNTGNRLSNAVSVGSLNHDLMGIALSEKKSKIGLKIRCKNVKMYIFGQKCQLYTFKCNTS